MPSPLTPEALVYDLKTASDPQIVPDASAIVFTLSQANPETKKTEQQLWLCDLDGGNRRQLTHGGRSNASPRWSPDGKRIAFVSDRVDDERKGARGIYVLDLADGGDAREVTRHAQGINGLAWSPDGTKLAYVTRYDPDNPDEEPEEKDAALPVRVTRRIDYKQDGIGYIGNARSQIFIVDVASGQRRKLTGETCDHAGPQWSPDGGKIAALLPNRNGMNSQLAIIDVASGAQSEVGPETGMVSSWAWSPNGDRIVFTGDTKQTWQTDFFVHEMASDSTRRITEDLEVLPGNGRAGEGSSQPVWLDDDDVLFVAVHHGASGLYQIDLSVGEVNELNSGPRGSGGLSVDADQRYVVQAHGSLETTGELAVYDRQSDSYTVITDFNSTFFSEHPAAEWERFEIERAGYTIESWLLKPPGFDENQKYPLVLTIHGGPNGAYGYAYDPVHQLFAASGYLVAFSNPRGSSTYGREFTLQVAQDWGGEDYQDLMAVVDHVLERPYADAERTAAEGYSYGGYMTSWILGQTQRFQAVICGAPCFDLESMYGTSDISHTFGELQWGGPPHEDPAYYREHSPATYAHNATTPTLIIHGEADERCPIGQGEQMFVALLKAGCEVEFARYPGGFHSFRRNGPPAHRQDMLTRMQAWLDDHL